MKTVGMAAVLEGLDGGTAGIAARGPDNGGARAAALQRMIHQPREQLHGHVLEGERGAMEEFEQPLVVVKLLQGGDRRMAEAGIGFGDHALQLGIGDGAADEGVDHRIGDLFIGLALEMREIAG
jgi:hypothetical protein